MLLIAFLFYKEAKRIKKRENILILHVLLFLILIMAILRSYKYSFVEPINLSSAMWILCLNQVFFTILYYYIYNIKFYTIWFILIIFVITVLIQYVINLIKTMELNSLTQGNIKFYWNLVY